MRMLCGANTSMMVLPPLPNIFSVLFRTQENTKYVKQKIAAVVIVQRTEGAPMTFGFLRWSKPSS